ncbi:MAG: hypothetical protein HUK08_01235 [Bacteroidaceae bacterium]|nr:hypothetical protein [Bacteroidaceae bacterium]
MKKALFAALLLAASVSVGAQCPNEKKCAKKDKVECVGKQCEKACEKACDKKCEKACDKKCSKKAKKCANKCSKKCDKK